MKNRRSLDIRLFILLSLGFAVSAVSTWAVRALPGVQRLELLAYDLHSRALPLLAADERIVIVGMDDESLSHLPLDRPAYPLPRTFHAHLLHELHEAGAKVVGFDIMFSRDLPAEDAVFARAIREHGTVLCGIQPEGNVSDGEETFRFGQTASALRPHVRECSLIASPAFGRVRWLMPSVVDEQTGRRYIHMSMGLAASYLGAQHGDGILRDTFELGPIRAPVGPRGEMLVRFAGPGGTFKPISYHEVYSGEWRRTRGDAFFRNKIVIVGIVNPLVDRHLTPVGSMQGVEILAQATQAILSSNWITHWSEASNYLFKAALAAILALAIWTLGIRRAAIIAGLETVIWIMAANQAFVRNGVWVDTVEPRNRRRRKYVGAGEAQVSR